MSRWASVALVALGSNLGESHAILTQAIAELASWVVPHALVRSSLWQSEPLDCPAGTPEFINAAVGLPVAALGSARGLLDRLQEMERRYGRPDAHPRNAPRTLDLDIITFGNLEVREPDLVVPHPRAAERLFVLKPLAELDAEMVLPGMDRTVAELIEAAPTISMKRWGLFGQ